LLSFFAKKKASKEKTDSKDYARHLLRTDFEKAVKI